MSAPLSSKLDWALMNPILASTMNPIIASPLSSSSILQGIALIDGVNIINHKLGRMMRGWFITDINGYAILYRSAPFNSSTLTLTSSAACIVNIGVF